MANLLTRSITLPITYPLTNPVTGAWKRGSAGTPPDEYVANMNYAETRNVVYTAATH